MTLQSFRSAACRPAVCRLLAVAFVFFLLFPLHFHVDHADVAGDGHHPVHVADAHAHAHGAHLDHHADSHVLEPAAHAPLKSPGTPGPWVVLLAALVLSLPLLGQVRQPPALPRPLRLPRFDQHSRPPLRAPPHP